MLGFLRTKSTGTKQSCSEIAAFWAIVGVVVILVF
jgi:hypothetical protein